MGTKYYWTPGYILGVLFKMVFGWTIGLKPHFRRRSASKWASDAELGEIKFPDRNIVTLEEKFKVYYFWFEGTLALAILREESIEDKLRSIGIIDTEKIK